MKIKIDPLAPGAVPMVRGVVYTRDTRWGPIAQAWPRKRGKPKTPYDTYKQKEFGYVARMAANPIDLDLGTAIEMVKDTSLVPRDFLMLAAYGTAYEIQQPDGFIWPQGRHVTSNPQYILDLITSTVGSMIWRSDVGWIAVTPGSNGQILSIDDNAPTWLTPDTTPGSPLDLFLPLPVAPGATQNTTLNACQGTPVALSDGATFDAIQFCAFAAHATTKVLPVVYAINGTAPGALIATGPQVTGVTLGLNTLPLSSTVVAATNTIMFVGAQITVAAFTQALGTGVPTWSFGSSGAIPNPAPATTQSVGTAALHCWPIKA